MSENGSGCVGWEATLRQEKTDGTMWDAYEVGKLLNQMCKRFEFQLERGEQSGLLHFQMKLSLRKKANKKNLLQLSQSLFGDDLANNPAYSPTSKANLANWKSYCVKPQTRVEGTHPFFSEDFQNEIALEFIPRQFKGLMEKLYPYQKTIFESAKIFEVRKINFVYNPSGNVGKSTIASLCGLFGRGIDLPPMTDYDKIIQSLCDICEAKNEHSPSPILFDMPRAIESQKFSSIFSAIEQIKKGHLCDVRHKYRDWWIDSPQIWVFSNVMPDLERYLSMDRWNIWTINEQMELIEYKHLKPEITTINEVSQLKIEIEEFKKSNEVLQKKLKKTRENKPVKVSFS